MSPTTSQIQRQSGQLVKKILEKNWEKNDEINKKIKTFWLDSLPSSSVKLKCVRVFSTRSNQFGQSVDQKTTWITINKL